MLEPLGLGWWAVNGETIQITSLAALEKIQRIEFYNVPPKLRASFASNQALVDSLQKELTEAAGKQGKPAPAHMEVDEPSGRLIVLATSDCTSPSQPAPRWRREAVIRPQPSLRYHAAMQVLFVASYNFARKNEALKNQTLAMASELSDHVWMIKELIEQAADI